MLVYRAINLSDEKDLENQKDIECSLIRTNRLKSRKNHETYYNLCISKERQYALDVIVGHIAGGRLRVGLSPWISTTKDFAFACSEYAMPQAGSYNEAGVRKPVIIIEANNVLSKIEEIKSLRNSMKDEIVIDLSSNNLNRLYKNAFMSEAFNENMPGYDVIKSINYELNPKEYNVNGYNNYATYAKEVLFFKNIKKENIKCIIYPLLQDIFYGCNVNIEKSFNFINKNINKINIFLSNIETISNDMDYKFYKELYPNYKEGINLTDYLYDNYNNIPGNNINEKYNYLKLSKKSMLQKITLEFNKLFNTSLNVIKLLDDDILVFDYNNPTKITDKKINDLLLIKKDNTLYKYNSKEKKYISNEKKITKQDIKQLKK